MSVRVRLTANTAPLDGLDAFLQDFEAIAYREFQEAAQESGDAAIAELSAPAPPVRYPIQWQSERQRKAFFATDGFGRGIPTRRTGAVNAGWKYETTNKSGSFDFRLSNAVDYAKFVYGSLAQNQQQAARFQQRFHRNTGWELAQPTGVFWLDALQDEYKKRMIRIARIETSRRTFTR